MDKSILSAVYNDKLVSIDDLANIRGSGQFERTIKGNSLWKNDMKFLDEKNEVKGIEFNRTKASIGKRVNDKWKNVKRLDSLIGKDTYTQFGLTSTHQQPTALANAFFSKENVDYLSKRIQSETKTITGYEIARQNENSLLIIMKRMYEYGIHGLLPQPKEPYKAHSRGGVDIKLIDILTRLNQAVLQKCVKQVVSGIHMYVQYTKDASSLPVPLSRPTFANNKGGNVFTHNIGLYSAHEENRAIQSYNLKNNVIN